MVPDLEAHLASKIILDSIETDAGVTLQAKAKALIFIRHHLAEPLKTQYMNELNPRVLWEELKLRYDCMKTVITPRLGPRLGLVYLRLRLRRLHH